jgi:hypothetical protein
LGPKYVPNVTHVTDPYIANTMTVRNPNPTESSLLLPPPDSEVSSETPADTEEGGERDLDAANQSVGTLRAVLIILALWVLIFLQGSSYLSK